MSSRGDGNVPCCARVYVVLYCTLVVVSIVGLEY
jgi:hypothetical protein